MRALVDAAEMRAAEREAGERGLTSPILMDLAGQGAAQHLLARPGAATGRYLVLVGPGNNGGDALVVARHLRAAGAMVQLVSYRRTSDVHEDTLRALPHFDAIADDPLGERVLAALHGCDTVIDGILGTGRSRAPDAGLAALLRAVGETPGKRRLVALDLPTGVNCDTGGADEAALIADETLVFGYLKRGLLLYPARAHCGELRVVDIGLPQPPAVPVAAHEPDAADVACWLPRRKPTMQKYSAGAVLALAGSPRYLGAPVLCCTAAMRAGAGYCTLATTDDAMPLIAPRMLEQTLAPLPSHGDEGPGPDALPLLQELAGRYGALLVGPGVGRAPRTIDLVLRMLDGSLQGPKAALVDADALYALAQTPGWPQQLRLPVVLTPHSGEMARLTGLAVAEIEANRFAVAARYATEWQQVVVLKGGPTIVAAPDGRLCVNPTGNTLLATAGSGDVLSGVIAAFLAGGAAPFEAARAAVYVHGLAADLARPHYGDRGMLAGDLLPLLPRAIAQILESIA